MPVPRTFKMNGEFVPLCTNENEAFCCPPCGSNTIENWTTDDAGTTDGAFRMLNAVELFVAMPLMISAVLPELVMLNTLVSVPCPTMISPMSVPLASEVVLLLAITAPFVPSRMNCGMR